MLVQFPLFVVFDEMYMVAGREKLGGQLATQFFSFSACKRHFGGKKYHILMFCTKIASIFEFIVIHAKICTTTICSQSGSPSGSLSHILAHSGSLSGSLRRSSAQRVLAWLSTLWTCGHTLYPILCGGSNFQVRNYALTVECGRHYTALSMSVSINQ